MIVKPISLITRSFHWMTLNTRTLHKIQWDYHGDQKDVYITFDDGPTPKGTPWILDRLAEANAKATFFCLGRNVDKFPDVYNQILSSGHTVGNHTYSHLKGFRTSKKRYLEDIHLAANLIDSRLFRPPYGKFYPGQARAILEQYDIIMWDVLSRDYNTRLNGEQVLKNVTRSVKPGSIILFHDSNRTSHNLYYALPRTLEFLQESGYKMKAIPSEGMHNTD